MTVEIITGQIASLNGSILSLQRSQDEKQEQLQRLRMAKGELDAAIDELAAIHNESMQPELTADSWAGTTANEFDQLRTAEIKEPFQEIVNDQCPAIERAIEEKISQLESEIATLGSQVSYQQSRLSHLQSEKRMLMTNG